jgi:Alginate lyase
MRSSTTKRVRMRAVAHSACLGIAMAACSAPVVPAGSLDVDAGTESAELTAGLAGSGGLVHPGLLDSTAQLSYVRAQIRNNKQPWTDAYSALRSSPYAQLSYRATPFAEVKCGSFNRPNVGCTPIVADGAAVYAHALLWSLTDDKRHADKAIEIMDAWARVYERNTESNARLVVAWAAPWYVTGAELLRYSNAGWTPAQIGRFESMLRRMLPYVENDERPENNWIQSRIEAHMAIAVFLNDRAKFDAAVQRWKFWVPIYLYQASDGPSPRNPPGRTTAETQSIWKSSSSGTSYIDGLAMETCRDLGHLGLGFGSMMYAAEMAFQQGVDLFTPNKKRLSDFVELHAGWMTGAKRVPSNICGGVVKARLADTRGISPPDGGGGKAWEIAYNHLASRLHVAMPFLRDMRNAQRPSGGTLWIDKWETLTHANRQF